MRLDQQHGSIANCQNIRSYQPVACDPPRRHPCVTTTSGCTRGCRKPTGECPGCPVRGKAGAATRCLTRADRLTMLPASIGGMVSFSVNTHAFGLRANSTLREVRVAPRVAPVQLRTATVLPSSLPIPTQSCTHVRVLHALCRSRA